MIYPGNFESKIGISQVRELVKNYCLYEPGKQVIDRLEMITDPDLLNLRLDQAEEFRQIISEGINFPIQHFIDISALLVKARIEGAFLEETEVYDLRRSLESVKAILVFLGTDEKNRFPALKVMAAGIKVFPLVMERIGTILGKNGKIRDNASKELQKIRHEISEKQVAVSKKLNLILRKARAEGWTDPDAELSVRDGRTVIPLNASSKRRISGYIHDESATGKTAYIEPSEIVEANNELRELENAERRELIKILTAFTTFLKPYTGDLELSHQFLAEIDACRAKARFAIQINAIRPALKHEPVIRWDEARHPLLMLSYRAAGRDSEVVPLTIELNPEERILLISGPNAGGKSVCLKTVGLLQYMLQCGFLVPVRETSEFGIFERFFIDIGDEQSIENDLSTYSSHLRNMKFFLKNVNKKSLVLIDEFGTGTEPSLGGAIAEAVLGRLNNTGTFGVITTHYTNLKHFAASAEGIINGAMLFDTEKIQPVFKLAMGRPGSSFAFEIARNIGIPEDILETARERAGKDHIEFDRHLRDIIRDRKYWENKRERIRIAEKNLNKLVEKYDRELSDTDKLKKSILREAKQKADEILDGANKQIENTIREIREAEAEKQRTREARQKLEEFREEVQKIAEEKDQLQLKLDELKKREDLRRKKQNEKPARIAHPEEISDPRIREGDFVMLEGQDMPGQVLRAGKKNSLVVFGNIHTHVRTDKLEKINRQKFEESKGKEYTHSDPGTWDLMNRRLNFSADIDLRGKRAEEALRILTEFIDEAIMVQRRDLRILHGKGNGILRELIRQQLKINKIVEWFGDEHVDRGGAGITLVRLDV